MVQSKFVLIIMRLISTWLKTRFLSRIEDLIGQLKDATTVITHLDLRSTYNQVRMADDGPPIDSIAATTFLGLTPNGSPCLLELLAIVRLTSMLLFGLYMV